MVSLLPFLISPRVWFFLQIPVIIGGSVMFGAVLGLLLLGESMMFQGWFGVALLMTGIGFVATDPGEKVAGH